MENKRIKTLPFFLFIFTLCFLFLPLSILASSRGIKVIEDLSHKSGKVGSYRALIIGINDYIDPKIPDLDTAMNDAIAMAKLLNEHYGFKVQVLLNRKATKKAIFMALRSLVSSTKSEDSVLIYYAGHGDYDRIYNDGWWIPVDAEGGDPVTYLDNVQVQKTMSSMKARHVLLISDSCYSGTLFGQARAMPQLIGERYYLNLYNDKSRWGLTSGNKTPVSDIGSGGHSVFAYQLIKALGENEKPYISTQEIYTRIAPIIGNNSEQTPICRPIQNTGDQGGEFVFIASDETLTDTSIDTNKIAYIPQVPDQVQPIPHFTLAIFPSNSLGFFEYDILKGLKDAIADFRLFFPQLTYYNLGYKFNAEMLNENIITPKVIKNMWVKKHAFSIPEPNIELISKLGKELQVDSILIYKCEVEDTIRTHYLNKISAFLIDIKNRKVYSERRTKGWALAAGRTSLPEDTKMLTIKVFNSFVKDKN